MNREFWDQRYRHPFFVYGMEPNAYLVSKKNLLTPGWKVLAVADGEGRNGVWLAQQGMDVLSVDGSEQGLQKARKLARQQGASLRFERADLVNWKWPQHWFDAAVVIFLHLPPGEREKVHRFLFHSLKPGGVIIMQVFHKDQVRYHSGGPPDPERLYTADLLRQDFREAKILELTKTLTQLEEGEYHSGTAAVINFTAQKPKAKTG